MSADPAEVLRRHDLQVTAQRLAVLHAVVSRPHTTANVIAETARDQIGTISRQSVHDTLSLLTERALIRRIQPAGSPARYEGRVGDNHHHLVCRRCDRLVDVECAVGETPCLIPVDDQKFLVDEAEVTYWGLCPECHSASRDEHQPTPTPPRTEQVQRPEGNT